MIGIGDRLIAARVRANTWPARDGDITMCDMSDSHLFYTIALLRDPARSFTMGPKYRAKLPALKREALRRLQ